MASRESAEAALKRWKQLELLQQEYRSFGTFLEDAMAHLGFPTSPVQFDIGNFLAHGPQYSMIQAQRGQAKTTITAAFAVWTLIHEPRSRVLILSAGGTQANEISTLIVRLIMTMEGLECLHPDPTNGDRTSVEAFDVHYSLKGVDKSPSVACVGITGNLQGKRADLLIADDIESTKNSRTANMRELLLDLTRDFTSICATGRIVYLGTPQSQESIYNTLPARGFTVRIWPGRFPSPEQIENYGDMLAPFISRALKANPALAFRGGMLGDQGQPIDPGYMSEEILQKKELDQGPTYFQLQHMLNTKLADAARFPLKVEQLVVMPLGKTEYFPLKVIRGMTEGSLKAYSVGTVTFKMATPHVGSSDEPNDVAKLQGICMYVDPAGGGKNADETGYAVTGFLNGNVYWLASGGLPGGYSVEVLERLAKVAADWKVNVVKIEKNMGYGAFREVWLPILRKQHPTTAVEDDMVTGQKELRIIETLEPVIARGSLIVNQDIVDMDRECCDRHEMSKRALYSVFHQMSKITRERNALIHDDRLDALEGAVRHWVAQLAIDQQRAVEQARARELAEALKDPLGHRRYDPPGRRGGSLFDKYRR
ncbi:MAG: phage terminase large subunit [Burkholderiales bacterium]|nr:phage terminase large subunit [Burkholderiales bacterium]